MSFLEQLAQAYLARERQRLGIPAEQRAAAESALKQRLGGVQAATAEDALAQAPEARALHEKLVEAQIRNLDEPNRYPPLLQQGTLKPLVNNDGEVVGFYNEKTGEVKSGVPSGLRTKPPAAPKQPPTARLTPVVNAQGQVVGTFNNITGEVGGVPGSKAGQPAVVGGEPVRKVGVPAPELQQRGALESTISDADELLKLAEGEAGNKIGPVVGTFTDLTRGNINPQTSDVNDLFHISQNLADQLLRARSGAQINEQEYVRLRTLVPNPKNNKPKFMDDLRRYLIEAKNIQSSRQGGPVTQEQGGQVGKYKVIGVE